MSGFSGHPFGVNLIGKGFNVFGIGEDTRAIADALYASSIPFCVIDYSARNGSATSVRRLEDITLPPGEEGPYVFNLDGMAAPIHARWYSEQGQIHKENATRLYPGYGNWRNGPHNRNHPFN